MEYALIPIKQTNKLNLIPDEQILSIPVSQYDTGDGRLQFDLYAGGELYSPSGIVTIQGTKPSGTHFEHTISASGSHITSDLYSDMTNEAGQVRAQIVVTEGDNRTGSQIFFLSVQKDAEGEL